MNAFHQPTFRWIATPLVLIILGSCTINAESPEFRRLAQRLEPTGVAVTFDARQYRNFDDYVSKTLNHLRTYKVYMDPENAESELAIATPFRVEPEEYSAHAHCEESQGMTKGIVLLHGLSDMPAAMRDMANVFAERCFVVYSMLLPGHGARPAELLKVSSEDWLSVARFGVNTLRKEVDNVYIGGFSLGGLVALQTAINDSDIDGVFAFSPALALHRSFYLDQTIWLRHVIDWLDTDPPHDAWRFESIPFNALAETQILARSVRAQLKQEALTIPVFIAQSPDDAVVDATVNQSYFEQTMTNDVSRLLSYASTDHKISADTRVIRYPSVLHDKQILSYAHQAVHIAPDNRHYGVNGDYRYCQKFGRGGNNAAIDRCLRAETPFRGEVFGGAVSRYDHSSVETLARLTYNPQFDELLYEIDYFIDSLTHKKLPPAQGVPNVISTL